jgi:plastocyanin
MRAGSVRAALVVPALAVALIVCTACTNGESPRFKQEATSVVTATAGADGVQRVDVRATDMAFAPNRIVVHPGRVELVVHNDGHDPHLLEIPQLRATTANIAEGGTQRVAFDASSLGSYSFDCAYHVIYHMTGELQVVAA